MRPWWWLMGPTLALGSAALAGRFTEPFTSDPSATDHRPFMWSMPALLPDATTGWSLRAGSLECRVEAGAIREARAFMGDTGITITDTAAWSMEVAFRHVSGVAPDRVYEAALYVGWPAAEAGQYSLLSLCYDAGAKALALLNGSGQEAPIPVDLSGNFHALRLAVERGQVRVYVDGDLRLGPVAVKSLACENPAWFILGPISQGLTGTYCCQWDYVAFTDAGALAPGEGGWEPQRDSDPVTAVGPAAADGVDPALAFGHAPYPGIRVLGREAGEAKYVAAFPRSLRRWNEICSGRPAQIDVPDYTYPDGGSGRQNVYRSTLPLELGQQRCVAMLLLTRGIDDTIHGYMDYKLWYCVSTNAGESYDDERPLIQRGAAYSRTHPNRYTWVGKNSFCFATLPPFLVRLSNGTILLPCYYSPLDDKGEYYNPQRTSTYSQVFCLIGAWNDARGDVDWDVTDPIRVTPQQSSGGLSECGVIESRDRPGQVFMAIRGGNEGDQTGTVPCVKWKTLSRDYGRTWSEPTPLTFSDGTPFWSPTAQAMFVRSSRTGKAYWIGNLARVRPRAGWPRYPLVMAELDEEALGLRRETVTVIDDRGPEDGSDLQLSNFGFLEDPATGHIVVMLNRLAGGPGWNGTVTYEIEVR